LIDLNWTKDDLLWRVQIRYTESNDTLRAIALKQEIAEKFPNIEIQTSVDTIYNGTVKRLNIVLVDNAVSDAAIAKIRQTLKSEM
jgi:hypothetical protein